MKRFLRSSGKWTDILPLAAFLSVIMMILGEFLSVLIVVPTGLQRLVYSACGDEDAAALMTMYLNFIGIWVAAAIFILAFRSNRPMLRA